MNVRTGAWWLLASGTASTTAFVIAQDVADHRASEFFEQGDGWLLRIYVGGTAAEAALAGLAILVLAGIYPGEPRRRAWTRLGWALAGMAGYSILMGLLRRLLV